MIKIMNYDKHVPLPEKYGKANVRLYIDFGRGDYNIRKAIDLKLNDVQMKLLKEGPARFMGAYGHVFSKNWDMCNLVGFDPLNNTK